VITNVAEAGAVPVSNPKLANSTGNPAREDPHGQLFSEAWFVAFALLYDRMRSEAL